MRLTRPQAFALMVLGYAAGLIIVLLVSSSAESTLAFALALGLMLVYYAYVWIVRDGH